MKKAGTIARQLMLGALMAATVPSIAQQSTQDSSSASAALEAERQRLNALPDTPGTGPFAAMKEEVATLPDHVVYRPRDLAKLGNARLGLYIFGNGACTDDGASSRLHLLEIASHGFIAIAPGRVRSGPGATASPSTPRAPEGNPPRLPPSPTSHTDLIEALDWALAHNADSKSILHNKLDPAAVAVSGFSCGGIQALQIAADPRVKTVIIMNSGLFKDRAPIPSMDVPKSLLKTLRTSTLYILGGKSDIAYENGMDDFARIDHVPVMVANLDVGHGGTYWQPNGGKAAAVTVAWLKWQLRGDVAASKLFVGKACGLCTDTSWQVEKKLFD
jgi:hypothetical protein